MQHSRREGEWESMCSASFCVALLLSLTGVARIETYVLIFVTERAWKRFYAE